ncbi:MAG: SGNH/GDSL hydrolase family protein [Sphingomonas sp.]|nr:SGNH/GDSL hydrolase family protein [Sphingomonas sp.]MDX3885807.1 SGNH/GDSL hydrolase family protein [Sphingomonas sp.]
MPSTKISALPIAGAIGGGELLPAVQGGGNVAVTPAMLRRHALAGTPPLIGRPFAKLMVDGDSKAGEAPAAARWVAARTPLNVWIMPVSFSVGGSTSGTQAGTGLTNPDRMAAMTAGVAAETAAGWIVDMLLTIGTNDVVLSGLAADTILANVRKYHDAFRAAGGRFLILMGVDPRSGLSAAMARQIVAVNRAYADYCMTVPDAIFCDTAPWWLDPAPTNAAFSPIGGSTGNAFSMAADGLHGSAYGSYRKQFALGPILRAIYRPRDPIPLNAGDSFDATTAPRGNMLGAYARCVALGGTSSIVNSGTGAIAGTPPLGWTATGTLTGDLGVAFSTATCAPLEAYTGSSGWTAVRIAFTGTPGEAGSLTLRLTTASAQQAGMLLAGSALLSGNALAGCHGISVTTANITPTVNNILGATGTLGAPDQLPQIDGLIALDLMAQPTAGTNSGLSVAIRWRAGVAMSGSIDLIGATWRRIDPIPAPAA